MLKPSFFSEMSRGLHVASTISGYIIGPLVLFGSIGYWLDNKFDAGKLFLIISLIIAFISSNILIVKNAEKISSKFSKKIINNNKD